MPFLLLDVLRAIWALRSERSFVVLALLVLVLLGGGSGFYWLVEDLRVVDAVYLSVMTLATVGYGDVTPVTDAGKVFTTIYVVVGIGILAAFVTAIAAQVRRESLLHRPLAALAARHEGVTPDSVPRATGEYDVLVIGSDEASREAAIAAAKLGLRVVVAAAGHVRAEPRSDARLGAR